MKSKRGELKSRKCGPDCSEKQYSEIRQVPLSQNPQRLVPPGTPLHLTLRTVGQRPPRVHALPVIRQGPIRRNQA